MKKIRIGVRLKLGIVFASIVILLALSMGSYAYVTIKDKVYGFAQEKLKSDLQLGRKLIDTRYPGDWSIKQGQLYKGDTLMEGDLSIIDEIGNLTSDSVTIFRGNTRVATNVSIDGVRQVNTQAAPEVQEKVLRQGKTFLGEADVVGIRNLTAYEPILNSQNEVIGMWFVGVPVTPYEQMVNKFRNSLILFGIFGYLLTMSAAGMFSSKISKRILLVAEAMKKAEAGDLTTTVQLKVNDELGQLACSFNQMMANLQGLIHKIDEVGLQINSSAEELSAGAEEAAEAIGVMTKSLQEVTVNTMTQSNNVDKTATMVERMSEGVQQVARNSTQASTASLEAAGVAEEGGELIKQAVGQMTIIDKAVTDSALKVQSLGEKSLEIGQIVDVITSIAGQTNLLALNAAIEAARAGEQGRGFAVVAEEVRQLAEQSAEAAKRIAQLINEIQQETQIAVQAMNQGTIEVKNGLEAVSCAGKSFADIVQAIQKVNREIEAVSASNQEIAANSEEVARAAGGIRNLALNCYAGAREVSATAEKQLSATQQVANSAVALARISQDLKEAVQQFKI
ncbi:MAG: HAMP domain-containing protein [Syntrophomonadaceae bacterium]|nr:HAMP domain-containing protein [Syntrophomonadaceae bacterium]